MDRNTEYIRQQNLKRKRAIKKRKIRTASLYSFFFYVLASIIFYLSLKSINVIPEKFMIILLIIMIVFSLPQAFFALVKAVNLKYKKKQITFCIIVSIFLIAGCVAIPITKGQLAKIFVAIPQQGQLNINLYVCDNGLYKNVEDLAGKKIGIQRKIDLDYQNDAIKQINKEIIGKDIITVDCKNIYEAIDRLYNGELDGFILNESYESIILENEIYLDFKEKTKVVYTSTPVEMSDEMNLVDTSTIDLTSKPFIIAITGVDQWNYKSITKTDTRSDVNILAVVNPIAKKVLLISLPRDSYIKLAGKSEYDKLTHSTTFSLLCWQNSLENLLDVQIDKYLKVNFSTLIDVVDALGGLDIDNPDSFDSAYYDLYDKDKDEVIKGTIHFDKGRIHLDGRSALTYCRERKHLSDGDLGRNRHQSIVLKTCIDKATSVSVITKVSNIIKKLQGKFASNLQMNEIYGLAKMQLNDMADWQIETITIKGENDYAFCYALQSEAAVVRLYSQDVEAAKNKIKQIINN